MGHGSESGVYGPPDGSRVQEEATVAGPELPCRRDHREDGLAGKGTVHARRGSCTSMVTAAGDAQNLEQELLSLSPQAPDQTLPYYTSEAHCHV